MVTPWACEQLTMCQQRCIHMAGLCDLQVTVCVCTCRPWQACSLESQCSAAQLVIRPIPSPHIYKHLVLRVAWHVLRLILKVCVLPPKLGRVTSLTRVTHMTTVVATQSDCLSNTNGTWCFCYICGLCTHMCSSTKLCVPTMTVKYSLVTPPERSSCTAPGGKLNFWSIFCAW